MSQRFPNRKAGRRGVLRAALDLELALGAHIGQRGEREKFLPGKKRRKEKEGEEAGETTRVVDWFRIYSFYLGAS